jgi:hypothetical protein
MVRIMNPLTCHVVRYTTLLSDRGGYGPGQRAAATWTHHDRSHEPRTQGLCPSSVS